MILHKYINQHFINVLKDMTLKVNDHEKFNDPFEFKPCIIPFKNNREINQYLNNKIVKDYYHEVFRQKHFIKSKEDFELMWRNKKNDLIKTLASAHAPVKEAFESVRVEDYFFILCLSGDTKDSYDEILMWSHYTNGHTGARLTIETDFFKAPFFDIKKVSYSKHRPSFHMADYRLNPKRVEEQTSRSMYTKSIAWKYENEYRLSFAMERCKSVHLGNEDLYFVDMNPEALREVVFGCKICATEQKQALELLKNEKFKHVKVRKAAIAGDSYRLNLRDNFFKKEIGE